MVLIKVLERRDAASLVAAIAAGLLVGIFLMTITAPLAASLVGQDVNDWKTALLQPTVAFLLQLLALEVLCRIVIAVREQVVRNRP